jgi:hypothetical protein
MAATLLARIGAVGLALTGLVHLLVPDLVLRWAATGYDRVLAVDFEPRTNATRRVRALGLAFLATGGLLWRLVCDD